jgi:hypothetical protein
LFDQSTTISFVTKQFSVAALTDVANFLIEMCMISSQQRVPKNTSRSERTEWHATLDAFIQICIQKNVLVLGSYNLNDWKKLCPQNFIYEELSITILVSSLFSFFIG